MTEEELREQIAELIDPHAWAMYRISKMPGWFESTAVLETSRARAQAIINDLGLTVEMIAGHDPETCDSPGCILSKWPTETRVVGKWEEA